MNFAKPLGRRVQVPEFDVDVTHVLIFADIIAACDKARYVGWQWSPSMTSTGEMTPRFWFDDTTPEGPILMEIYESMLRGTPPPSPDAVIKMIRKVSP